MMSTEQHKKRFSPVESKDRSRIVILVVVLVRILRRIDALSQQTKQQIAKMDLFRIQIMELSLQQEWKVPMIGPKPIRGVILKGGQTVITRP